MLPGPVIIRRCPGCGASIIQETVVSGNTYGARYWTDGKCEAPMMPDTPELVKCPDCGALLWIRDAKELGRCMPYEAGELWPSAVNYVIPSEADYYRALGTGLTGEREVFCRIRAWWASNDAFRGRRVERGPDMDGPRRGNLARLLELLRGDDPDAVLTSAEIHREMGRFPEALALLGRPLPEDYRRAAAFLRGLAERGVTAVRELS